MAVDRARARELFGGDELGWVIGRLRRRLERREPLEGRLRLDAPTEAQRDAVESLTGRRPGASRSISIEVADLLAVVRHAGIADDLPTLVEAVSGPVDDLVARADRERTGWQEVTAAVRAAAAEIDGHLLAWVDDLESSGLLRRFAPSPELGRALAGDALQVLAALPGGGRPRAELAASVLGDSHALDDGRPVATLVLRGIEAWTDLPRRDRSASERRALWARVGVLTDELSAPALALNLPAGGDGLLARILRVHADAGEPARITLRQLVRHPVDWGPLTDRVVSVCENPTVVAAAAMRLGRACSPLVCTDGQPSGAVQTLLAQLVEAGVGLRFHVDHDVGGLRIGNLLVDRFAAVPWRMGAADYAGAAMSASGGRTLEGDPPDASWDDDLRRRMRQLGRAVHEEQVLEALLQDLGAPPR